MPYVVGVIEHRLSKGLAIQFEFRSNLGELLYRESQILFSVSGGNLGADTGFFFWYDRVRETNYVYAFFQDGIGYFIGENGIA